MSDKQVIVIVIISVQLSVNRGTKVVRTIKSLTETEHWNSKTLNLSNFNVFQFHLYSNVHRLISSQ